jgi:hypothetical protein
MLSSIVNQSATTFDLNVNIVLYTAIITVYQLYLLFCMVVGLGVSR